MRFRQVHRDLLNVNGLKTIYRLNRFRCIKSTKYSLKFAKHMTLYVNALFINIRLPGPSDTDQL